MHPYEVAQTLRFRAKHESIKLNYGSLYNVVESLEKRGLIEPKEVQRDGRRPERTVYAITGPGVHELVDWLSELVAQPAKEYPQFGVALSLISALPPDQALALLGVRAHALGVAIAGARAGLADGFGHHLPRLFIIEAELELAQMETDLRFTEGLIAEIESGSLSGLDHWQTWFAADGSPDPAAMEASSHQFRSDHQSPPDPST